MINPQVIGFAIILSVTGLVVDYHQQSVKAKVPLGELSADGYWNTVTGRYQASKTESATAQKERIRVAAWQRGGKPFLPEAYGGWTRRSFKDGDNRKITAPEYLATANGRTARPVAPLAKQFREREQAEKERKLDARSWVYERGEEVVWIQILLAKDGKNEALPDLVSQSIREMNMSLEHNAGFGVIGGVAYVETLDKDGQPPQHFSILNGVIGLSEAAHIRVHAFAGQESTRELLAQIDYDGLNKLLALPVPTVGNSAVVPQRGPDAEIASRMGELRREFEGLRSMEAQHSIDDVDATELLTNTYAGRYLTDGGPMDLVDGKAIDLNTAIKIAYRLGLEELMIGGSTRTHIQTEKFMHDAVEAAAREAAEAAGLLDSNRNIQGLRTDTGEDLARQMERIRGFQTGECLELPSTFVVCGERARAERAKIKINRPARRGVRTRGRNSCGAGNFCSARILQRKGLTESR